MKFIKTNYLKIVGIAVLTVLAIAGYRSFQVKADAPAPVMEIALTDKEQKPILDIIKERQAIMKEFDAQIFGAAKAIAAARGVAIGQAPGEYLLSPEADGRIKLKQNPAQAAQPSQPPSR